MPERFTETLRAASEPGSAFVPWTRTDLAEILCHQEDRVVGKDNTVTFGKLRLQIEPSPLRVHFVKATVELRRYAGLLARLVAAGGGTAAYALLGLLLAVVRQAAGGLLASIIAHGVLDVLMFAGMVVRRRQLRLPVGSGPRDGSPA